jgi:adenosylcobinamide-GDP ribazoletransferase
VGPLPGPHALGRTVAAFLLALEFLTIVRLRRHASIDERTIGASVSWFPSVGLLIGCLLVAVDWGARAAFPVSVATIFVVLAAVAITGALHLDGLADTADGLFGGHGPVRRLEIMKDSHIGTFGVVAVVVALMTQFAALGGLAGRDRASALLAAPAVARFGAVLAIAAFPAARASGLGHVYRRNAALNPIPLAIAAALLVAAVPDIALLVWAAAAAVLAPAVAVFAVRRLGGLTGDVYGALIVVVESAVLVSAAGLVHHSWSRGWLP